MKKIILIIFVYLIFINNLVAWTTEVSLSPWPCSPSIFQTSDNYASFYITVDVNPFEPFDPTAYYADVYLIQDDVTQLIATQLINESLFPNYLAQIQLTFYQQNDLCFNKEAKLEVKVYAQNDPPPSGSVDIHPRYFRVYKSDGGGSIGATCSNEIKAELNFSGGEIQMVQDNYQQKFVGNCGWLPSSIIVYPQRYKITRTINKSANETIEAVPSSSVGFSMENSSQGNPQTLWSYVESQNSTTATLITYVYYVEYQNFSRWWPCAPEDAVIAYKRMTGPTAHYVNATGPTDNIIYIGETKRIHLAVTGNITHYEWTKKYCGTLFPCNNIPNGLIYNEIGNIFEIKNIGYTGELCEYFCGGSESSEQMTYDEITLKLYGRACNQYGCSQFLNYPPTTNPDTRISFSKRFRSSSYLGCPNVVTFKDGITEYENNLLHRNEAIGFGADLDDYIVIKNDITESDSTVSLYIKETDDKYNYFDQIKMYAYDLPPGCKVVISENNQFYLFDTTIMASSSEATLNNEEDITSLIQYNPSVVPDNDFLGNAQDVIDADFSSGDIKNISTDFYNMFQDSINNGQTDSIALIIQMDRNPNHNANVKMDAGTVMVTTENDIRYYTIFRRENMDYMVLPISTRDDKVSNINITMNRDYRIRFIGVTGILNITEGMAELSLIEAFHSDTNLMVPPSAHIVSQDDDYLTLDSSQYLKLTYSSLPYLVAADYTRKHILFVNGHYTGILGRPTSVVSNDNTDKFELFENKPNPFNPTTTISFSLPKDSFVKIKVYNLLGQLIATLSNEVKKAGYNEVKFDGTNLASGIYFYHFDIEGIQRIKKMVLIK